MKNHQFSSKKYEKSYFHEKSNLHTGVSVFCDQKMTKKQSKITNFHTKNMIICIRSPYIFVENDCESRGFDALYLNVKFTFRVSLTYRRVVFLRSKNNQKTVQNHEFLYKKYDHLYTFSMYLCWKSNFIFSILERMFFRLSVYLSRKIVVKNDDFRSRMLLLLAGWLATGFTVLIVKVI